MLASDIKGLSEAYLKIYAPKFETVLDELSDEHVEELTDDLIEEVVTEVFYECLEEGYDIDDIENVLTESLENSISALNEAVLMELNPYAPAGSKESGQYNKATTKSKKSAENAAKRAETIEKVKGAVKKVGSAIKQKAASAAVSAYAAGKMAKDAAKPAAKAAGKAALHSAGKVAGKAVKYAKKAGEAVSSGYKEGSDESDSDSSTPSKPSTAKPVASSSSSDSNKGSLRRAAGSLLKKAVKKVVGKTARAVAGTARVVHGLADKGAKRLGESSINEEPSLGAIKAAMATKRSAENAAGMRGPELTHGAKPAPSAGAPKAAGSATSGSVVPPRSREFSHGSRPLKNVMKGGLTMSYAPDGDMVDEQGPALPGENRPGTPKAPGGRPHLPGEKQTPLPKKPTNQLQLASYEPSDMFDLVLEYLLETGHAETISEAQYIMAQMDSEMIENILEDSSTLAAAARKRAQEMGAKRRRTPAYKAGGNRGTGRNERAAYNLSNTQRSAAANLSTQTTRSKKPSHYDSGMHQGDYDRYNRKDPKKNPKHDANK